MKNLTGTNLVPEQNLNENLNDAVRTFEQKVRTEGANRQLSVRTECNYNNNNNLPQSVKWIRVAEGANRLSITLRTIQKHIKLGHFVTRKIKMNGGWGYEISVESIFSYYETLGDFEKCRKIRELMGTDQFSIKNKKDNSKLLDILPKNLTDKQKHKALLKDTLLRKYEESFSFLKNGEIVKAKLEFIEAYNSGELLPNIYEQFGARSYQTFERWYKEWIEEEKNPFAIAPHYNYKNEREISLSDLERNIFLNFLLKPEQIKISKAYQLTKYIIEKKYNQKVTASENKFRRFADEFKKKNNGVWTLLRDGEKRLMETVLPYIQRDVSLLEVGDVFVADGKTTTFNVIDPFTGKAKKATFIAYMDWKSLDIAGYELMITENTQAVTSALRNGILRLGKKPKIAYQDNGKAFKNKFFRGAESFEEIGWTGLFAQLNITPVYAMPYNARAKIIEGRWKEMVEGFEKLLPSFTGVNPINKPAYIMRNEKFLKDYHNALTKNWVPSLEEAKELIEGWLEFYRSQPCPNVQGKTIGEVFNEGKGEGVNKEELDELMMKYGDKPLLVKTNGVNLLNAYYYTEELTAYVGQKLWVKYSLFDINEVVICDERGRKLFRAERRNKVHPMANYLGEAKDVNELQTQLRQISKLKKNIKKQTKEIMSHHERINYLQIPEKTEENENLLLIAPDENEEEKIYLTYAEKEEAERKKSQAY